LVGLTLWVVVVMMVVGSRLLVAWLLCVAAGGGLLLFWGDLLWLLGLCVGFGGCGGLLCSVVKGVVL
jgi:hypothetical protein